MGQYCSIWQTAGLQSSCWRGCEERMAEMCGIAGWSAPAHPRLGGNLVRRWSSTAQYERRLGSNRAAGGDARSDGQRCVASLTGLCPRARDSPEIWFAELRRL